MFSFSKTAIFLAFLLAISSLQAYGQNANDQPAGSWQGVLNTGTMEIRLVFNISVAEDGSLNATLDNLLRNINTNIQPRHLGQHIYTRSIRPSYPRFYAYFSINHKAPKVTRTHR